MFRAIVAILSFVVLLALSVPVSAQGLYDPCNGWELHLIEVKYVGKSEVQALMAWENVNATKPSPMLGKVEVIPAKGKTVLAQANDLGGYFVKPGNYYWGVKDLSGKVEKFVIKFELPSPMAGGTIKTSCGQFDWLQPEEIGFEEEGEGIVVLPQ